MSSMRNAVQRRNHKERSQPQGREKWGILEKHKDYSLRAADYNQKKRKLNILSQKAKERNPDEFAFGMLSAEKSKQGKHGQNSQENVLSHDTVRLLKTQDQGYLRTIGQKGRRQLEELEREIKLAKTIDSKGQDDGADEEEDEDDFDFNSKPQTKGPKKIKFNDDLNEPPSILPSLPQPSTTQEDSDSDTPAPSTSKTPSSKLTPSAQRERALRKSRKRLRDLRASKLQALKLRQREIVAAAETLELQRARMGKTNVVGGGGVNSKGIKFRGRERKR